MLILQQDEPDDYVIGTGESHTVREFVELALNYAGIEIEWHGAGLDEKGVVRSFKSSITNIAGNINPGDVIVEIDPHYFRPAEVDFLLADASKAMKRLGWEPKVNFNELIKIMVDADLELLDIEPVGEGKRILADKEIHWTSNRVTIK